MNVNSTLVALLLMVGTTATFAQTTTEPVSENQPQARMGRNRPDPEMMANRQTERLTTALSLDDATRQKVHAAALKQAQNMQTAMANRTASREDRMKTMKASNEEFDTSLKSALSADQYKKYQAMREKMKDEYPGRRGQGGMRPSGDTN